MKITFHALPAYLPETYGGKAAALARLSAAGFDVPPFLVALVDPAGDASPADIEALARTVGPGPYAVRSSATQEDGPAHSHAGQFLSFLDVPAAELTDAILRVQRSGAQASVEAYRTARGLTGHGSVAVVVQAMVSPDAAGVMFTADPVTGRRDRTVISAVEGLAEQLVQGEVEGFDYLVDKASGEVLRSPDSGPLSADQASTLASLGGLVEASFGGPQDIEWTLAGGKFRLVQSRPITTALRPAANPDAAETILDNSNIVESYPGTVSPLTYSFAVHVYARVYRTFFGIVGVPKASIAEAAPVLDNMLSRVDGRVYYNLINWYRALALVPGFGANRRSMETMMGVSEPLPQAWADRIEGEVRGGSGVLAKARVASRFAWRALRLRHDAAAFNARLAETLAVDAATVGRMSLSELATEYRRVEAALLDRWDAPLVNDFLCMAAFGGSRRMLERWCGPEGLSFHNDVMIGQGDIVSAEPARRIREMARKAAAYPDVQAALAAGDASAIDRVPGLRKDFDAYLAKFGDRCVQELKLESIPLTVDASPLVASIARTPGGDAPAREDTDARLSALLRGRPVRLAVARRVVAYARARVRDRENLRFERTRIFAHARRVFLAMGSQFHALGVLENPRDALDLTVAELLGAIEGSAVDADLAALVAFRQAAAREEASRPDPAERLTVRGPVSWSSRNAAGATPSPVADEYVPPDGKVSRLGTGCGAGTVRARARVIRDPRTETLEPGEVLVARHTDPGWIAVFTNASAIVVERGSLLSHSAIVARELGIPCVVGLKDATGWIRDGETVVVNGATGLVTREVA